jgi:hypothetical protein
MGHPMEHYYDGERAERARLWERRDAMEKRLADMPLSAFTFGQFADLTLLADRGAVSDHRSALIAALDRLDAFLAARKKPAKPRRRHR